MELAYKDPAGRLRFIEVKGLARGAATVTLTRNEILTALNKPDAWVRFLVEVDGAMVAPPCYIRREPDCGATSVNYNLGDLLGRSMEPE